VSGRSEERLGALTGWNGTGRGIKATYGDHCLSIAVLEPGLARVRVARHGIFAPRRSWSVVPSDDAWPPTVFETSNDGDHVCVRTSEVEIRLARSGGTVDVHTVDGRPVCIDGPMGGPAWEADGRRGRWTKQAPCTRRFFGFGERTGLLDKSGMRYTCWTTDEWRQQGPTTDALYVAIPFFLGLDVDGIAHGIFLNNTFRTAFDLSDLAAGTLLLEVEGGELDYYVIYGPDPAHVVQRFCRIVGRPSLPPRWALGYHQSRWGYENADQIRHVARELRSRGIPADAIHLDIDHMDGCRTFTWDGDAFPDPAALISELGEQGLRVLCVVDAGIKAETGYRVYREGTEGSRFLRRSRRATAPEFRGYVWPGLCVFPDFLRDEVRDWWGTQYRAYTNVGVAGFLNDMNEPAMHSVPLELDTSPNCEPPADLPHGDEDEPATHAEVRNVYANQENRATVDFLQRERPGMRPLVLTRAGFAGLQRDAAVWTGDNASRFEHLEMSLPQILNLGLSGVSFAGADIGGFFESCGDELLIRWTQLGAFYPFARNHSAKDTTPQEPWVRGARTEAACRRAIELRYRLLPYLYTLFREAAEDGTPILRPLFWHFPADPATHAIADEALVGDALLIAPVLRPGKQAREVYLPEGTWIDLRSRRSHVGPAWVLADAPLSGDLPIYARGGCIVPFGPLIQWSDQRPVDPLRLEVFPDDRGQATGTLYEDDGVSMAYQDGCFAVSDYAFREGHLSASRTGGYEPPCRSVVARLGAAGATAHERPDTRAWTLPLA
jgi:alpha-glucosidase